MAQPNINLTIVVSGQPVSVKVNLHQKIDHVIEEALKETGNKGQPAADWELRTSTGSLIDRASNGEDAGLIDGMTLYLSPRAGAGGGN